MLGLWNEIGKRWPLALLLAVVAVVAVGVAVVDADARAIDLRQLAHYARVDSRNECKAMQLTIDFGIKLRKCESWSVWACGRQSLSRPDRGWCDTSWLMDDARGYAVVCDRRRLYRVTARGSIRRVAGVPRHCVKTGRGLPS